MTDHPKLFRDLSDAEKGALLLAHHEGRRIVCYGNVTTWVKSPGEGWHDDVAYRIAPEPLIPDSIDWSHVADDVVAMARNNDCNTSRLFKSIPTCILTNWWCGDVCADSKYFASYRRGTVSWKGSLVIRPGHEVKP